MNNIIDYTDFSKVHMCVGTIIAAEPNIKAHKPAYVLTIDFGEQGIKTSSAQITDYYQLDDLIDQQVIAVMNFPSKRVAGIKSEVLVLGAVNDANQTILLQPERIIKNGMRIA